MNSNQGSKTWGFHHRLVLGSLKSLPWNCQRVPPLPVLSDSPWSNERLWGTLLFLLHQNRGWNLPVSWTTENTEILFNNSSNKLPCKFHLLLQAHFSNSLLVWSNVGYKLKRHETNLSDENSGKDYFPLPYWKSDADREKEMLSFCSNTH